MQKIREATLSSKGQVTIPKIIRDMLHVKNGESIAFYVDGGEIFLTSSVNLNVSLNNKKLKTVIKGENEQWKVLKRKLKIGLRQS